MEAEIINRPISGDFPEIHFGEVSTFSLWVKFTDDDFQEWVGSFCQGWDGYRTFVLNLDRKDKVFVVAGGNGYFIDITSRQLLNKGELSGIKTAILNNEQTAIYFSEGYSLNEITADGEMEALIDNYYFDDIELIEIKGSKLYAKYWYYQRNTEPFYFELDIVTKAIKDTYNDSIGYS